MDHWVEAADWIVWQLCGTYVRNACTAGFKGARQDGAYPPPDYFAALNPAFERFVVDKVEHPIGELGARAGGLTPAMAEAWGCPRASRCASATSTPTSPRPPPGRSGPGRWSPSWAPRPAT